MKSLKLFMLFIVVPILTNAQNTFPSNGNVGIGTTTPASEAILEINSTTKGVYFPRMTQVQRNAIVNPQLGLIIFQTNGARGLYFYNGSTWAQVTKNAWQLVGNSGLNPTDHFIGTKDNVPVAFRTNNVERLRISENGDFGFGTTSPNAGLHINHNNGILFQGQYNQGTVSTLNNNLSQMAWISKKAAFRAGRLVTDAINPGDELSYWNSDSIGNYSFASGYNVKASGSSSTSFGNFSDALGANSFASGRYTTASGNTSFASGLENYAKGNYSAAFNNSNTASGSSSFAAGNSNQSLGTNSVSFGSNNLSDGDQSFVSGIYNATRGDNSVSFGSNNISTGMNCFVVGLFNDTTGADPNNIIGTSPLFQVGTGDNNSARKNSFTVYKNGSVNISGRSFVNDGVLGLDSYSDLSSGIDAYYYLGGPSNRWGVVYASNGTINTSDIREKKNIEKLKYGTEEVLKLNPVTFEWKEHPEFGTKIGLIAQDLQKVIPEVVSDEEYVLGDNGKRIGKPAERLGVYYSDLIPVLIKAFQEEHSEVEKIKQQNTELIQLISTLERRMESIERDLMECCNSSQHSYIRNTNENDTKVPVLEQNNPNPFNQRTTIQYYVPEFSKSISLILQDELGNPVKKYQISSIGKGSIEIEAGHLAAGVYTYTLQSDTYAISRKLILTK